MVFLAADSWTIISNFLAMARADWGCTGGGEVGEAGGERGGGVALNEGSGGGVTRCGGGACGFLAGLLVTLRLGFGVGVSLATLGITILMSSR